MKQSLDTFPGHLILLHPNIPKPLHGLNPRTLNPEWWDNRRREAYARFNDCCWACRTHKSNAMYQSYLDAHECYIFNYQEATATFVGVSALCYCCHNYIHDGRLYALHLRKGIASSRYRAIISHGNGILSKNGVPFAKKFGQPNMVPLVDNPFIESTNFVGRTPGWNEWRLIIGKQEYKPLFSSLEEWRRHYSG